MFLELVRTCLGRFYFVSCSRFFLSYFILPNILLLFLCAPTSSFTLAVPMREVYCVRLLRYTPRAWDPHSLQSILNSPFIYRRVSLKD